MILLINVQSLLAIKRSIIDRIINKTSALIAFILLTCLISKAQSTKVDSLKALLEHTDNDEGKLKITTQLSKLTSADNPLMALGYAEKSVKLANAIKSDSLINKANLDLATVYLILENYPQSLQLYYNVIKNVQKNPNPNILFKAYSSLGNIYFSQKDYKKAIKNYNKVLEYLGSKTERNIERKAGILNNIGASYESMKQFDKAAAYYKEALILSKKINDQKNIANILNNQGSVYQQLGKKELALTHYLEALDIRKRTNNKVGLARSNNKLGQYYYELKDYKTAERYFNEAINLGRSVGSLQILSQASSYLYKIYKKQGKYKEAFTVLEINKETTDSLFNDARTRKIAQLEMQFEFDRKQTKQREKELYYWLGSISLGLSLIIVTLLFYLQRNKTRKSQVEQAHLVLEKINLERNIELKDKELTTNILNLMQKNELIDEISEKLLDFKQNVAPESQTVVQKVVADLQSNLHPELLQEFEFRFQQVHEEFFNILNEKFPNLSPSERRLCAFLKLNMTTKEISAITHQNTKSIEIARTRLRKKLNLTGTDLNLVTFLSQLDQTKIRK